MRTGKLKINRTRDGKYFVHFVPLSGGGVLPEPYASTDETVITQVLLDLGLDKIEIQNLINKVRASGVAESGEVWISKDQLQKYWRQS
jgi:hypothetical protein